jgi:hypothetical protein
MIWKYTLAWLVMPFIGIINGIIRESTYQKILGELPGHQVSTFIGISLFGLYVWLISACWRIQSAFQAVIIGGIWLGLTCAFEFLFGHYVMKHPWSRLFHDYNVLEGRLWILVLIFIAMAPYLVYKVRLSG